MKKAAVKPTAMKKAAATKKAAVKAAATKKATVKTAATKKATVKTAATKKATVKTAATKKAAVKAAATKKVAGQPETGKKKDSSLRGDTSLPKEKRTKMPAGLSPMLATLVDKPFDDPDWVYEVKWDGYRALAYVQPGKVSLLSRNNKSFDEKFYPIHDILSAWTISAVLDGEIVALNEEGRSNFNMLQNWRSEADAELVYYVFDILWHEGKSLMHLPLTERQRMLRSVLPGDDRIRISESFTTGGTEFFHAAGKMGLEGIMAKRAASTYIPGDRTRDWLKIKVQLRQEVVIGGFTRNEGTSKQFSSLLLGVYEEGKLQYVGKVGTGFSDKLQKEMMKAFTPLIRTTSPFRTIPDYNKPSRFRPDPPAAKATWLKPVLVCEVSFTEVTEDGVFRHPSFEGMRTDKNARQVVRELAAPAAATVEQAEDTGSKAAAGAITSMVKPAKDTSRNSLLNPSDKTQVRNIKGHTLKFSNLDKLYWPDEGITKRDMLNYYYRMAEYILPYLKDRPQSLNRFPNGAGKPGFYQKDVKGKSPEWVKTFPYTTSDGEHKEFLVGDNEDTLLWMASLGCIEMNPWFSRVHKPDNPDYCVIDLDPDKQSFDQVIEAALAVKSVLDGMAVPCYCKTSGSTGMHIYIPLGAKYSYDQSQMFGRIVVTMVQELLPGFTTIERTIRNRGGKMYLDFLQNRPGATLACPYSLRPKPGATVSMPLHWDEVKPGLRMKDFTIYNAADRTRETGDLFKGVLGKGINLAQLLKKLNLRP